MSTRPFRARVALACAAVLSFVPQVRALDVILGTRSGSQTPVLEAQGFNGRFSLEHAFPVPWAPNSSSTANLLGITANASSAWVLTRDPFTQQAVITEYGYTSATPKSAIFLGTSPTDDIAVLSGQLYGVRQAGSNFEIASIATNGATTKVFERASNPGPFRLSANDATGQLIVAGGGKVTRVDSATWTSPVAVNPPATFTDTVFRRDGSSVVTVGSSQRILNLPKPDQRRNRPDQRPVRTRDSRRGQLVLRRVRLPLPDRPPSARVHHEPGRGGHQPRRKALPPPAIA